MGYWDERYKQVQAKGGNFDSMICWSAEQYKQELDALTREIQGFFEGMKFGSVLDFGCGIGRFRNLFDAKYLGVDVVADVITSNRKQYPDKVFQYMAPYYKISVGYDLVFCVTVLQHMPLEDLHKRMYEFRKSKNLLVVESLGVKNVNTPRFPIDYTGYGFKVKKEKTIKLQEDYKLTWAV